jgi:hypothetical protein
MYALGRNLAAGMGRKLPSVFRARASAKQHVTNDRVIAIIRCRLTSYGNDDQAPIASSKVHVAEAEAAP